jgi:hypothetical protein
MRGLSWNFEWISVNNNKIQIRPSTNEETTNTRKQSASTTFAGAPVSFVYALQKGLDKMGKSLI